MNKANTLFVLIFVSTFLYKCTQSTQKLYTEKVYEYYYKMGELSKEGRLDSETKYNENGKVEEELQYGLDDSISIKTIYRYNNEGKLTEQAEFSNNGLAQKKLITYNELGKKDMIEYYQEEDGYLIRGAWLKIFYNKDKRVREKKWLGSISENEEYIWYSHTDYIVNGQITRGSDKMPNISREDTSIAKYYYNEKGKISRIEISGFYSSAFTRENTTQGIFDLKAKFENHGLPINITSDTFQIHAVINYKYNSVDSLISKGDINFIYKDGLLEEINEKNVKYIFNKDESLIEKIIYGYDKSQLKRFTYKYNFEKRLIETTEYNNANEPTRLYKTVYEYQ